MLALNEAIIILSLCITDTCTWTGIMKPRCATTAKILLFNIGLLLVQGNANVEAVHDINILFITSFGQFGFNSSGVIPAADIALEDINKDPNMLPGYKLTYDRVRDSQVSQYDHWHYCKQETCILYSLVHISCIDCTRHNCTQAFPCTKYWKAWIYG